MPRYHFHRADGGTVPDAEGTDLPDLDAARTEAVRYAGRLIQDHPSFVWDGRDFRVEVTDEDGILLCTVVIIGIDSVTARGK